MVDARFVALSSELRSEMAEMRGDLRSEMASQTRILVGTHIASMLGLLAGLILGFG